MSSERAWAAAMAMKSAQSTENTQKKMAGSTRRQIISRFGKAIQYAQQLLTCLKEQGTSHASGNDVMEAAAYLACLKGGLYFEKAKWDLCIQEYSIARLIYTALGTTARTDVFKELLSSTVDPSIRYAAYQLRFPRTKAVSDIAIERFPPNEDELRHQIEILNSQAFVTSDKAEKQGAETSRDIPSTISWRGRTVKIEDAAIAQAIATANEKERELAQTYASSNLNTEVIAVAYDDVINARQEAVDATKAALDELTAEGVDTSDVRVQSLQLTRTAVNYAVIELRVGRNRVLCGKQDGAVFDSHQPRTPWKSKKDTAHQKVREESTGTKLARLRERAALYDSILQNIDAVNDLSGVAADSTFVEELSSKRAYFRSLKYATIPSFHKHTDLPLDVSRLVVRMLCQGEQKTPLHCTRGLMRRRKRHCRANQLQALMRRTIYQSWR
jgi:signal recognition particle subunit SRP68